MSYYNVAPYDQIEFGTPSASNIDVSFHTNGSSKMWIKPDGKVGIGTYTPSTALEVAGTVKATAFQSTSGAPSIGKVLTATDNLGNATWQNVAAFTETDPEV